MHGCNTFHRKADKYIDKKIHRTNRIIRRKNILGDKKEKRDKARRTMYLRHCCVGSKNMVGSKQAFDQKGSDRQINPPKEILSWVKKDHFMETWYERKKKKYTTHIRIV